jgi:hypothetical protein
MPLAINLFGTHSGWRWRSGVDVERDRRPHRRARPPELPVGWSGIREGWAS